MKPVDPHDAANALARGLIHALRHYDNQDLKYVEEAVSLLETGILKVLFFLKGRAF